MAPSSIRSEAKPRTPERLRRPRPSLSAKQSLREAKPLWTAVLRTALEFRQLSEGPAHVARGSVSLIPKGSRQLAQGCAGSGATLGRPQHNPSTPTGLGPAGRRAAPPPPWEMAKPQCGALHRFGWRQSGWRQQPSRTSRSPAGRWGAFTFTFTAEWPMWNRWSSNEHEPSARHLSFPSCPQSPKP
jgi:hypothetical protein